MLEPRFLRDNPSFTANVDISFKAMLSSPDAPYFYGSVYPYFDPVKYIGKRLPSRGLGKRIARLGRRISNRIPEAAKYFASLVLGILAFYLDLVKDIIIASGVSFLYDDSEETGNPFKNLIVIVLWTTVFLSHLAIGLKVIQVGPSRIFSAQSLSPSTKFGLSLFLVLTCPVAPALLLFLSARHARTLRRTEKKFAKIAKVTRQ